ncbi:hypothetical protein [Cellulomonas wangsupingiae]|uniref:hypothetical protein n=1 Tax=Cellulomonas wangsupingiae TaxID=2968085 RepID=UPI001D0E7E11|nr:hypothetical protein [Cellulomonas wangsupingiae]MCM0640640.1 hypothetical protein [Cellulomonas wangsupingiae]
MGTDERERPQDRDRDPDEPAAAPVRESDAPATSPPDEAIVFDGDAQTTPYPRRRRP